jgi:hypothetical protein
MVTSRLTPRHLPAGNSGSAQVQAALQGPHGAGAWLTPQLLGSLSALRVLLAEAEDLRMSVLSQLQQVLSLRQFALILARPLELLHTLNCTAAALQQLQFEGRLCL